MALCATLATIGVFAAMNSAGAVLKRVDPQRATALTTNPAEARATLADVALGTALQKGSPPGERIEALATAALRDQPVLPNALRDLGYVRAEVGDRDGARKLMFAALDQSRRDPGTLVWLIDDAARRGRIAESLKWFDIVLRNKEDTRGMLFPKLAAAVAYPPIRREFVPIAKANPSWLAPFYTASIEQPGGAETISKIVLATDGLPADPLFAGVRKLLLDRLVIQSRLDLAAQVFRTDPKAPKQLLVSPAIDKASIDPRNGGMGWVLGDDAAGNGSFLTVAGRPAIGATIYPGRQTTIASKILYLDPGRYALGSTLARDLPVTAKLKWELLCVPSGVRLLTTEQAAPARQWQVSVPASCPAQRLQIVGQGPEGGGFGEFTVTRVSLDRR